MKRLFALLISFLVILGCGTLFVTAEDQTETVENTLPDSEGHYYIVFAKDNWAIHNEYRLILDWYRYGISMTTEDRIKVVYSRDGITAEKWYPSEEDEGCTPLFNSEFMAVRFYPNGDCTINDDANYKGYLYVFPAEPPTEPSGILGDADDDGNITIFDATAIQKHLANMIEASEINLNLADFDQDGDVTILDATAIQRNLADL